MRHFDVIVVGSGLSGVSAAYRLQTECPSHSFAVLEARHAMGGTWDLFRYPGVRSDSDMNTLGFVFDPWHGEEAIADGERIREYIVDTARRHGVDRKVMFGHKLVEADWCSQQKLWVLKVETQNAVVTMTCGFLYMGSGYYDYARGHSPDFPGRDDFTGQVVHPQHWPENLELKGRRVIVIGSGATAISLLPALAQQARHVTMLQRSPSYIVRIPSKDAFAAKLGRFLPRSQVLTVVRWRNILYATLVFRFARQFPTRMKEMLFTRLARHFTSEQIAEHFTPRYEPWDQRLCFCPDGDLFKTLTSDRASIVTGQIETFTENGIRLTSGQHLDADLIVTATGLVIKLFGGARLCLDGDLIDVAEHVAYKGMMLDGVPNLAMAIGYTNMSWTLKCDLTARYVCRLLNFMKKRRLSHCFPSKHPAGAPRGPLLDFSSGYVQRGLRHLPGQGQKPPWRVRMSYLHDLLQLRYGSLQDGIMQFRQ